MRQLQQWYAGLQPRERWLIVGGGILVLLVAIYTLALAPLYQAVEERAQRVQRKQADLAWIQSVSAEVQALAANQPTLAATGNESLVVLIDRAARECGLSSALTGQTPNGESGIRVRLEAAEFDKLVMCLGNLQQAHAVTIESATIDRTSQPGLVNASLVLTRPG